MAKPSLTNIILFYNMSIGRKELFIKKCNIWLISLEKKSYLIKNIIDNTPDKLYNKYRFSITMSDK